MNAYTYSPDPNYFGSDSFTFTVSDGALVSAPATVSITVVPVNDRPVAQPQTVPPFDEDTSAVVTLTGSDVEGTSLTITITSLPAHGTLTRNSNFQTPNSAVFTYTPDANYNGSDAFAFTVGDNELTSDPAVVSLTVRPVNDPPVVAPRTYPGRESLPITITLLGTDADNDPLLYTIASLPSNGNLSAIPSSPSREGVTVVYTSKSNFKGNLHGRFLASAPDDG